MILKTESVQQSTCYDDTDLSIVAIFAHLSPGPGGRSSHDMILLILAGRLTADPVPPVVAPFEPITFRPFPCPNGRELTCAAFGLI